MSFFTELQIRHTDFNELDLSSKKQKILEILKNDGIHEEIYSNLATAFANGKDSLNVDPIYCFKLIEKIIKLFPNSNFECRGLGEEYFYTWIICVENGQIIFKYEPWTSENPFI